MIARRQDIDTAIVEFAAQTLGQSETARRILSVDDDEVDVELPP